jgi:hypothetical protein
MTPETDPDPDPDPDPLDDGTIPNIRPETWNGVNNLPGRDKAWL